MIPFIPQDLPLFSHPVHPKGKFFVMSRRLFKGKWNADLFDHEDGSKVHEQNVGFRIEGILVRL